MTDPIVTLMKLNAATLHLNYAQFMIDRARYVNTTDQHFQLELDREQTEVDEKRKMIEQTMADIRNRN